MKQKRELVATGTEKLYLRTDVGYYRRISKFVNSEIY